MAYDMERARLGERDGGGRIVYKVRHICGGGMVPQGFQGGMGTPEMTLVQ